MAWAGRGEVRLFSARSPTRRRRDPLRDAAGLEAERLLSVACTRAKWQLLLTATVVKAEESAEPAGGAEGRVRWAPRAGSLLAVLWPVVGAEFSVKERASPQGPEGGAPRRGPLWRVPQGCEPKIDLT